MKKLTMIISEDISSSLADVLRSLEAVQSFTFIKVEGHSNHASIDQAMSTRDQVVGYRPQVRVDLLLDDEHVSEILAALRASGMGLSGHGVYWVTPIEESGKL